MQEHTKDLVSQLRERYGELSKGQRRIADYILNNPQESAFLSINDLSRESGSSPATITRFSRMLGFAGYQEFQRALYDSQLQQMPFGKLKTELQRVDTEKGERTEERILSTLQSNIRLLEELYTPQNCAALESSAAILRGARRIYVAGNGSSYAVAYLLGFMLRRLYDNVQLLEVSPAALAAALCDVRAEDCLVVAAYSRYTKVTCSAVSYCKKVGCPVIAVTDSLTSQVALDSTHALVAPRDEYFSPVSAMAMCSCLFAALGEHDAQRMLARMDQQDKLALGLGVYL